MKVVAIVQARRGSSRLPDKVTADVAGAPLLSRVLARARAIPGVDAVMLATTSADADAELVAIARDMGCEAYAGSETDVLDRYYRAAEGMKPDAVMRITADCPLLDPLESGRVLERFVASGADYASNVHPRAVPDGLDTEVCSFEALARAWREAGSPYEREHVTPHLWQHGDRFRLAGFDENEALGRLRLTVDYPEDLALVRAIYTRFSRDERDSADLARVLHILQAEPELLDISPRVGWTVEDLRAVAAALTS